MMVASSDWPQLLVSIGGEQTKKNNFQKLCTVGNKFAYDLQNCKANTKQELRVLFTTV